jgi:hypothetical protein
MTSAPAMVDSQSWAHCDRLHAERVLTHGASICTVRAAYDQDVGSLAAATRACRCGDGATGQLLRR